MSVAIAAVELGGSMQAHDCLQREALPSALHISTAAAAEDVYDAALCSAVDGSFQQEWLRPKYAYSAFHSSLPDNASACIGSNTSTFDESDTASWTPSASDMDTVAGTNKAKRILKQRSVTKKASTASRRLLSESSDDSTVRKTRRIQLAREDWPQEVVEMNCRAFHAYLKDNKLSPQDEHDLRRVRRRLQGKRASQKLRENQRVANANLEQSQDNSEQQQDTIARMHDLLAFQDLQIRFYLDVIRQHGLSHLLTKNTNYDSAPDS